MADTQLRRGSQIQTKETRTTRVMLRESNDELRIPNDTHVSIEEMTANSEQVTLVLHRGSIWSSVSPRSKPDSFRVRTPELTAGVRGTRFQVDRIQGATQVSVYEGVVQVTANATNAFVTLKAGQAAAVNASGQIMDLIAIPPDQVAIRQDWDNWAANTSMGGGGMLAGGAPIGGLSQQIAQDNAAWEATMAEGNRLVAENKYMDTLQDFADAFERLAADTGYIPESGEGWSMLKFDPGIAGWNGPYVEGPVPPLDPWKRPLLYKKLKSRSGNTIGRVYSVWQDGRDQGGENSSQDRFALVMYFEIPRFKNDPNVVAPPK